MLRSLILFSFTAFFLFCTQAQAQTFRSAAKNSLYAEGYSRPPWYSVNFDRVVLTKENLHASMRLGFTVAKRQAGIPLGVNLFTGSHASHFVVSLVVMPYIVDNLKGWGTDDRFDKSLILIPGAGYRYQKAEGGIYFHALALLMTDLDPGRHYFWDLKPITYMAGSVALGYSF